MNVQNNSNPPDFDPDFIKKYAESSSPSNPINVEVIRNIALKTFDNYKYEDRCIGWLVMLGIYPSDYSQWAKKIHEVNSKYWDFVGFIHEEYGGNMKEWHKKVVPQHFPAEEFGLGSKNSTMGIIHGDLVRTGRILFTLPPKPIPGSEDDDPDNFLYHFQEHVRRLERILFVFSQLNTGIGYMQGFNELVTPFYYTILKASSLFDDNIDVVEAFTYNCFQELMTQTKIDEFYNTEDKSSIILHQVKPFVDLQFKIIPKEAEIIESLNIHPLFYCLRWFALLFSQEYDMPSILMIWDSLFAHFDHLMEFVFYVGVATIKSISHKFEANNYAATITALQNLSEILSTPEIPKMIQLAEQYWSNKDVVSKPSVFSVIQNFLNNK